MAQKAVGSNPIIRPKISYCEAPQGAFCYTVGMLELRELSPQDDSVVILPAVPVSEAALHGLVSYDENGRPTYSKSAYLEKLSNERPSLYYAMGYLCEEWGVEGEAEDYFQYGFALTYTTIANQAELFNTSLGRDVEETALQALSANILLEGGDGMTYVTNGMRQLTETNIGLVYEWTACLQSHGLPYSSDAASWFAIGGIIAHDLIGTQMNHNQILEHYESGVN